MLSYEGTMLAGQAAIINHYANPVRTNLAHRARFRPAWLTVGNKYCRNLGPEFRAFRRGQR